MEITYSDSRKFSVEEVERLFLSVGWLAGKYPQRLQRALCGYSTVYCARDGERLVGLVTAVDDGEMMAYVHYLLVEPEYQGRGIGRRLLGMIKSRYADYLEIMLIAAPGKDSFYTSEGFTAAEGTSMCISKMEE